jgi:hypothetical protein
VQQLQYQVVQDESVLPVYQSRLKKEEELNRKLGDERHELTKNIEHLKERLDRAESLVFSMGTPEAIRQRKPSRNQTARDEGTDQPLCVGSCKRIQSLFFCLNQL